MQGIVINNDAVADVGLNIGMLPYSGTICALQLANGGDDILLQRHTDSSPTGYFIRALNTANTVNLFTLGVDGSMGVGPNTASGVKLHVSQEANTATTEFKGLGIEGDSTASSTGKSVSIGLFGRDTINTQKQTARIAAEPADANWVGADLVLSGRVSDAIVETLRLTGGKVKFSAAASFSANAAVATTMTSLGPTGSHATIQEWLTIQNASGVTRYIPCY
jgi:hypothetical protein